MIDISPATRGNTPNAPFTESYDQVGYAVNPYTGLPYQPEMVKQGDFGRVVAEFWADGPRSTAPPGHWNEIANDVTDKMDALGIPKRIGGAGPGRQRPGVGRQEILRPQRRPARRGDRRLEPQGRLRLGAADFVHSLHGPARTVDRSESDGRHRRRHSGQHVHPDGLPLEPGLVEVITPATTAPGERHEHLAGHEGKIAIRAWQGAIDGVAPFDDPSEISGVDWIPAETWMPYQLIGFVTPPFAGYVSGHSTYSRTGGRSADAVDRQRVLSGRDL